MTCISNVEIVLAKHVLPWQIYVRNNHSDDIDDDV